MLLPISLAWKKKENVSTKSIFSNIKDGGVPVDKEKRRTEVKTVYKFPVVTMHVKTHLGNHKAFAGFTLWNIGSRGWEFSSCAMMALF